MLHVQDLTLIHKKDLTTLMEGISFSVSPGERLALIGEEGNGKSSLLRAILRDESLDGYIEQRGRIVNSFRTGYLPQELPAACRSMSAYEYFCEDPVFYDQTPRRLGELAARLALPADVFYSEQPMSAFSGGERVKLQLARLMMRDPELLLLDEPTNDLASIPVTTNFPIPHPFHLRNFSAFSMPAEAKESHAPHKKMNEPLSENGIFSLQKELYTDAGNLYNNISRKPADVVHR